MRASRSARRTPRVIVLVTVWWTSFVVTFSVYEFFGYRWRGRPLTIGPMLHRNALGWGIWLVFFP